MISLDLLPPAQAKPSIEIPDAHFNLSYVSHTGTMDVPLPQRTYSAGVGLDMPAAGASIASEFR
jgi:hypothetical protein